MVLFEKSKNTILIQQQQKLRLKTLWSANKYNIDDFLIYPILYLKIQYPFFISFRENFTFLPLTILSISISLFIYKTEQCPSLCIENMQIVPFDKLSKLATHFGFHVFHALIITIKHLHIFDVSPNYWVEEG